MVEASRIFALPQSHEPATSTLDVQHYPMTVIAGECEHTLYFLLPMNADLFMGLVLYV